MFGQDPLLQQELAVDRAATAAAVAQRLENLDTAKASLAYERLIAYLFLVQRLDAQDVLLLVPYLYLKRGAIGDTEETISEKTLETLLAAGFGQFIGLLAGLDPILSATLSINVAGGFKLAWESVQTAWRNQRAGEIPTFQVFKPTLSRLS